MAPQRLLDASGFLRTVLPSINRTLALEGDMMRRQTILVSTASLLLTLVLLTGCNSGSDSGVDVKSTATPSGAGTMKAGKTATPGSGRDSAKSMAPSTQ